MKIRYLVVAASVAAASSALALEQVIRTEKSVTQTQSADGTNVTRTVTTTVSSYVDRVRTVYTSAGLADTTLERVIELERRLYTAYTAGDWTTVRRIRIEIRDLLSPDQVTKVYAYYESNPLPADIAPISTYTFLPQQQFQTHVVQNQSGRIAPGSINVPGVSATVNVQDRPGSDANIDVNSARTGANRPDAPDAMATINRDGDAPKPAVGATESHSATTPDRERPDANRPDASKMESDADNKGDKEARPAGAPSTKATELPPSSGASSATPSNDSSPAGQPDASPNPATPAQPNAAPDSSASPDASSSNNAGSEPKKD